MTTEPAAASPAPADVVTTAPQGAAADQGVVTTAPQRERDASGKFAPKVETPTGEGVSTVDPEDAALGEIWDRVNLPKNVAQEPLARAEEGTGEAETGQTTPEDDKGSSEPPDAEKEAAPTAQDAPKVEAPADLPEKVRAAWDKIPEEARNAVLDAHREMGRKNMHMGRTLQAVKPVQDALVQAIKELPSIASLTPDKLAQDVMQTAKLIDQMNRNPVQTFLHLAQQRGIIPALQRALMGQQPDQGSQMLAQMTQRMTEMQRALQEASDPRRITQAVQTEAQKIALERDLIAFRQKAPYWNDVAAVMPTYITLARQQQPGLPPADTLALAYDMAVNANPILRAKVRTPAPSAQVQPDPQRTAEQIAARSVNVQSRPTGRSRQMTEDEILGAAFDAAQARQR